MIFVSNPRTIYDPACAHRHGGRLAAAAPTTGHHLPPRGKPCPQSATRWPTAPSDRHRTPPPRGTRPSTWLSTPHSTGDAGDARHTPTLVSPHHRAEVRR